MEILQIREDTSQNIRDDTSTGFTQIIPCHFHVFNFAPSILLDKLLLILI